MVTSSAISLSNLTKWYGKDRGIEEISFEVAYGQVFGFLGPNGSGKSTAMRLLMGLLEPTSGSATILGKDALVHNSKLLEKVGYLPGALALYKNLTAREYLKFLAKLRGRSCDIEIKTLAERLNLDLSKHIHSLSRGNRQKVGVIQAFMHHPDILILDEPTSGLDPLIQREFELILKDVKSRGAAVLLSSHILSEVENLADRIGVILEGRILLNEDISLLKERAPHTITLTFPNEVDIAKYSSLTQVVSVESNQLICSVTGSEYDLLKRAVEDRVISVATNEPTLDEIFLDLMNQKEKL